MQSKELKQAKALYEGSSYKGDTKDEMDRVDNYSKKEKLYYPGKSEGQPYKRNKYRYCYSIMKVQRKVRTNAGDEFDNFISQADKNINHYENYFKNENPYNPYNIEANFNVTTVDEDMFETMKMQAKREG